MVQRQQPSRQPPGHQRLVWASLAACAAIFLIHRSWSGGGSSGPTPPNDGNDGWAGSFLHSKADKALNALVDARSKSHKYKTCSASKAQPAGAKAFASIAQLELQLGLAGGRHGDGSQRFTEAAIKAVPCGAPAKGPCCPRTMHFRPNTTDFKVYQQIFMWHYMSYLYPIFENYPPKYILDAGANAGFSTTLFKLLWPDAVVVSVEPDPDNYEALVRQTQGLEGVHTLNAGLWGRKARIGQTGDHGAWGKVFREKRALERGGMQAFGVADIAARFDIPAFDFVKIDIEGAEGAVFGKGADTRWTAAAKVISLEVHDYFADYFGLKDVSTPIDAVMGKLPFTVVSDNEHVMYLADEVVASMRQGER